MRKDVVLRKLDPRVQVIEWHFFPDVLGRLGPDPALLALLKTNKIPYTIWTP